MPRPRLEDAKPRLLAAGLSLFAKLGTERVNSNAIARRARVGIGTFYAHFEDKYALLQEVELRTLRGLQSARLRAVESAGASAESQARAAIGAAVDFAAAHPEAYRVTFGRERASLSNHRPQISDSTRPTATALRRIRDGGALDPELDVDLAARAFAATETGTLLWWLEDVSRAEPTQLVDTLTRLHPIIACQRSRSQ